MKQIFELDQDDLRSIIQEHFGDASCQVEFNVEEISTGHGRSERQDKKFTGATVTMEKKLPKAPKAPEAPKKRNPLYRLDTERFK